MRMSINVECLFQGLDTRTAYKHLKDNGYNTIERWMLSSEEEAVLARDMAHFGLELSAFCTEFFILNQPEVRDKYIAGLSSAVRMAQRLGCTKLITQVGQDTHMPRDYQRQQIIEGLCAVKPILEQSGVTLMVEPLCEHDHPGYFLLSSDEGFEIISQVASPNIKLLFDVYHQLHTGEKIIPQISKHLPDIAHFHIAGYPRRDDKIWENFNYANLLDWLAPTDTPACIGVELFSRDEGASVKLLKELSKWND